MVTSIALIAGLVVGATSAHSLPESHYQEKWCAEHHGKAEVVLPDKTRADCLTENNAVEVEFGRKWAEAIGQSLYYSFQTGKRAGIVLILEKPQDRKHLLRLNSVINHYNLPIDAWTITP
ncbi:MAG: hypothetical protein ACOY4W_03770 [Thermodesulfobacteriota bacterium]